ncbi:site-specific DNA-methyltransferase [Vibrio ezurae]|uniref:site-specific DNA-methyltransferase (adenine-specific) n=1 Tax=Vibrio ezurae NBRC 102218 TaxID=1219080 RepID=U3CJG8_9VIBR|nr:site-specific DNA-methyltransferase [Vibrio ezurae]GAD81289.1 putative methyltransferase [Vibrio ezurae NBRC 102218]
MSQQENSKVEKITGNSPEAKSLDITNQNIEQLKQLFPDVFSEGKIDFEVLKAVLGEAIDDSPERYNFTWSGKTKARQIAQTPSTGTLRPCKGESINWDTTENLFIEGDNLEVLKLLQKSYHKKVKMIYIDPPYNTGKDFVYRDNFHDNVKNYFELTEQVDNEGNKLSTNSEASGRYHSDWLNMIYPRLKLARNLLTDDGVLFASIDDNEVTNFSMLLREVFGDTNVEIYIWDTREEGTMPKTAKKTVRKEHEYILAAFKSNERIKLNKYSSYKYKDNNDWTNPDNDPRGPWMSGNISRGSGESSGGSKSFAITNPEGVVFERDWSISEEEFKALLADNRIYFANNGSGVPRRKIFANEPVESIQSSIFEGLKSSQSAKRKIADLIGCSDFDYPKPTELLSRLIEISTMSGDIVMDFFAGTGSLGHAAYELSNKENRKFILIQLPEKMASTSYSVISELTIDRLKSVTPNTGLKVFKLDETNIRPWEADFENLELVLQQSEQSIKGDRTSEDVLYEIFLKYGYDLTTPVETELVNGKIVFVVGAGALFVCLDDDITTKTVEGIAKLKEDYDPETTQVVFKDEGFADDRVKTNAIQILKQAAIDDVKSI